MKHSLKEDLQILCDEDALKHVILGNRRGDPYSDQISILEPSSEGWPDFV